MRFCGRKAFDTNIINFVSFESSVTEQKINNLADFFLEKLEFVTCILTESTKAYMDMVCVASSYNTNEVSLVVFSLRVFKFYETEVIMH